MIVNGMNQKYEEFILIFIVHSACFINQPGSRQPSSKRSALAPKESHKGIKSLAMPAETGITKVDNHE